MLLKFMCLLQEEPPSQILEYLVPRRAEKEELTDEKSNQKNDDDDQGSLEDCSLMEIDERIDATMKQIEELTLQLEVYRKARLKKVESFKPPPPPEND